MRSKILCGKKCFKNNRLPIRSCEFLGVIRLLKEWVFIFGMFSTINLITMAHGE